MDVSSANNRQNAPDFDAAAEVIATVLAAAEELPDAMTNHVILRACRSTLQFKSPQDESANCLVQRFEQRIKATPTFERSIRDALGDLADQASSHVANEESEDHSLLAFLRTLNS